MAKTYDRVDSVTYFEDGVEHSHQSHTTTFVQKATPEPSFVKCYLNDLGKLKKLQGKTVQILFEFLRIMNYRNEVNVSVGTKQDICESFDIYNTTPRGKVYGINVVDQHIYKLIKAGVIARKRKGQFVVNPELFGKGTWKDVRNVHLHIVYKDDGSLMYAEVNK